MRTLFDPSSGAAAIEAAQRFYALWVHPTLSARKGTGARRAHLIIDIE